MTDYSELINTDSFVVFIDFYKAFNTIEHSFLLETLHFPGFNITFCNLIKMLCSNIYSSISSNFGLSPRFRISRGIRQGCPISAKLFILATQMLALLIRGSSTFEGVTITDMEFKISQFADDTALFLKDKSMIGKALNDINASGLSLNIAK